MTNVDSGSKIKLMLNDIYLKLIVYSFSLNCQLEVVMH